MTKPTGRTALYRLFDAGGTLLYVGISSQPQTRWTQHATDKPWWPLVRDHSVEWHPSRLAAEKAERTAVSQEGPLYNTAGASRSLVAAHFPVGATMTQAQARLRISDVLDAVQFHGKHTEITRRGKSAGVLVPPDWYDTAVAAIAEIKALRKQPSSGEPA